MNEADSASNTRAVDSLLNFETVKYFTATRSSRRAATTTELQQAGSVARRNNRLSLFGLNGGQALIIAISQTTMIGLAAWQVCGTVSSPWVTFILINQFMIQLFMPLGFLGFVFREIRGSLANIEKMFELMAEKPSVVDPPGAPALRLTSGGIRFEGVGFGYSPERQVLRDVDFEVKPGQKLAVVGASGSGKSTLVKLLFRFYDPVSGRILVDGQDIRGVARESLRRVIGIVPQDTVLFNDSIFENVRYGDPGASDAQVREAIRLAHLEQFIEELPRGGATLVGERGPQVVRR